MGEDDCLCVVAGDFALGDVDRRGDFALGEVERLGDFSRVFALGVAAFTGDSSFIGDFFDAASDLRFNKEGDAGGRGSDILGGKAPLLTGVEGGSFFTNSSGLNFGPNDTRFLFDD